MNYLLLTALLGLLCCFTTPAIAETNKWPYEIIISDAEISIFQPQLESFKNNKLTARSVISIKTPKAKNEMFCTVWFSADTMIDKSERIVRFKNVAITKLSFPGVPEKVKINMGKIITDKFLSNITQIELDRLLPMLDTIKQPPANKDKFINKVPQLFFSKVPAILVSIDGDPKLKKIDDNLMRVINTPFLIILDVKDKTYYLNCVNHWFTASSATGPWAVTTKIPEAVKSQKKAEKTSEVAAAGKISKVIPKIFVATKPAELIQSSGEPIFSTIPGTNLLYIENSENDVFQDLNTQQYYILIAGRWFTAAGKAGPWKYISSKKLPADFSKISPDSPKADVLFSIAGTEAAKSAILEATIPQTITVKRSEIAPLEVKYSGEPEFVPIKGTNMTYAVNTTYTVIKSADMYYCCYEAIWYQADKPTGPWTIAVAVPDEIYAMPPDSPVYNAKYAKIYDYDQDDDEITYGYTSGYDGSYYDDGSIIYGTGYYYNPWYRRHYYPRPVTYGYHARYNRYTGNWGYLVGYRGPNGGIIAWKPSYGSGDWRWHSWNNRYRSRYPSPGLYNNNRYSRYSKQARQRLTGKTRPTTYTGTANRKRHSNNILSDRNGQIYRKNMGGWERRNNGAWQQIQQYKKNNPTQARQSTRPSTQPSTRPSTRPSTYQRNNYSQLNRQLQSRYRGTSQTRRYNSYRSSSSYRRSSSRSYSRPSRSRSSSRGGGRRGGRR
ncbi:MAG: hypothetical protein L3J71_00635 [Victivallaceae bacterium]|nr:hypothetical protein [Victivallaceae bacterium]